MAAPQGPRPAGPLLCSVSTHLYAGELARSGQIRTSPITRRHRRAQRSGRACRTPRYVPRTERPPRHHAQGTRRDIRLEYQARNIARGISGQEYRARNIRPGNIARGSASQADRRQRRHAALITRSRSTCRRRRNSRVTFAAPPPLGHPTPPGHPAESAYAESARAMRYEALYRQATTRVPRHASRPGPPAGRDTSAPYRRSR